MKVLGSHLAVGDVMRCAFQPLRVVNHITSLKKFEGCSRLMQLAASSPGLLQHYNLCMRHCHICHLVSESGNLGRVV